MEPSIEPDGWKTVRLDDVGRIVTGKTPSTSAPDYFGSDVPFVTPRDKDGRKVISRTERYLTRAGVAAVKGSCIPAGAVMVSCIGSDMGKTAVAGRDCVTNQQINSIVVAAGVSSDFVYYNLLGRKPELQNLASGGSAQPILNKGHFARLTIALPPRTEQIAIAQVLGALDNKIEVNRRMSETLEAVARVIFKSWFEDFEPVRAKAEGRQPVGVDPAAAALFPDAFQESSLGKIPSGWRVGTVTELLSLAREVINPWECPEEDFAHYSIPAFDEGRVPHVERGQLIKSNKFLVPSPCVLLSKLNPRIPRVWLPATRSGRRAICSTEFLVALPRPSVPVEFLYCLLGSTSFLDVFAMLVTGTSGSHQRVRPEDLLGTQTLLPPPEALMQFADVVRAMFQSIAAHLAESQTLAALRDTLLPRLLSGEMRVKDAKKFVGATA